MIPNSGLQKIALDSQHRPAVDQATPVDHCHATFRNQPQRLRVKAMLDLEHARGEVGFGVAGKHRHRVLRDDRP